MSKALEAWKKAKFDLDYHRTTESKYYYPKNEREEYSNIIESSLERLGRLEKALEIIKNKGIDIDILRWSNTVAEYNAEKSKSSISYTQEEYETVVGVVL